MNYQKARRYVLIRLQEELPKNLYYHGIHHTLDVCGAVKELAIGEKVKGEDLTLLQTAAVYHDIGFIEQYFNNEPIACRIARETLPGFDYLPAQIEIICNIILASCIPQQPHTHLEEILCDADLDYLGRADFFEISNTLLREWQEYELIRSEEEWNVKQIHFLEQHRYFTKTAREKRDPLKQQHLQVLKKLV